MEPLTAIGIFAAAVAAGLFGSLLGLGGGIIIIPALTLIFGVDIRHAAATSLLCVVATSVAATAAYLRQGFTNIRLGLLLELSTVLGAVGGGLLAFLVPPRGLVALFGALLIYTAYAMWRDLSRPAPGANGDDEAPPCGHAVPGAYVDPAAGHQVSYHARHLPLGILTGAGAGIISGLLGVGGGIIQVPLMRLRMHVPLKAATATSSYMIGITAAASVMLYFRQGAVNLRLTALCALGVLLGATLGPSIGKRMPTGALQRIFVAVLLITAGQMLWRAYRGGGA